MASNVSQPYSIVRIKKKTHLKVQLYVCSKCRIADFTYTTKAKFAPRVSVSIRQLKTLLAKRTHRCPTGLSDPFSDQLDPFVTGRSVFGTLWAFFETKKHSACAGPRCVLYRLRPLKDCGLVR